MTSAKPPINVLIAEDDEIVHLLMQAYCDKFGIACRLVRDGVEALNALAEEAFDLVILDCQMPVMDGYSTVREIRARNLLPPGKKVIALSAGNRSDDNARCLAAGFDEFVPKPIKLQEFGKMVSRLTETPLHVSAVSYKL